MYLIYINYLIYMLYIYNKLVCTLYSLHEGDSCYACYVPSRIIGFYGAEQMRKTGFASCKQLANLLGGEANNLFLSSLHTIGF